MSPDHMGDGVVDDHGPQQNENKQCFKFHSSGDGTGDQSRCDDGEHHLEERVSEERDRLSVGSRLKADTVEEGPGKVPDHASVVLPEGQGKPDSDPEDCGESEDEERVHKV